MVREVISIPLTDITIERPADRRRVGTYFSGKAEMLGESMRAHGQHTPVLLQRLPAHAPCSWSLIAGLHRFRGAAYAGLEAILGLQVADENTPAAVLRRLEVSENLDRRDLLPIERSKFLAEHARLAEIEQHGDRANEPSQVRAIRSRYEAQFSTAATIADVENWDDLVARSAGIHPRTLRAYRAIFNAIVAPFPDLADELGAHSLCETRANCEVIVKIKNEAIRRKVIAAILADPEIKSVDEAKFKAGVSTSKGGRMSARDRAHSAFITHWEDMRVADQKAEAAAFADHVTPGIAKRMISVFQKRGFL